MKKLALFATTCLFATMYSLPAQAILIWGTDATGELTGSRTSPSTGGVTATEQWDNGGFTINWTVTQTGVQWTYSYDVVADTKALSHFILEVTDDGDPFNILPGSDAVESGDPRTYSPSDPGNSNPLLPNDIFGVKFDFGLTNVTYTIVTDRAPVYGVFYTKDGKNRGNDVVAWSNALSDANYKTTTDLTANDYIVRPNGSGTPPQQIPEPGILALFGIGLTGIGLTSLRRRQRKAIHS